MSDLSESGPGEVIDLTKTKDGGVLKTILRAGQDANSHPAKFDTIFMHYVGTIKETGKTFDSSRARDLPHCFSLGRGQVPKGMDLCVQSMCRGELARLECHPDYAYGANGLPQKVPGNATLIYEVELLRWEGEDLSPNRDGNLTKSIIKVGKKYDSPSEHSKVQVHAVGSDKNGRVFYDRHLEFILGEGSDQQLPSGIDKAICRMDRGEKAHVICKGIYGYELNPPAEFGLPLMAELHFKLTLKDFEKTKASWEMSDEDKIQLAQSYKERGTQYLNAGKYNIALNKYNAIIFLMEFARPSKPEDQGGRELSQSFEKLFIAALLNSALASLRMGDTIGAIKFCDRVLEKKPKNVKAMYRKAQAYQQRMELTKAISVFQEVLSIEPENKAAAQQILDCQQQMVADQQNQRKKFSGMFSKSNQGRKLEQQTVA